MSKTYDEKIKDEDYLRHDEQHGHKQVSCSDQRL